MKSFVSALAFLTTLPFFRRSLAAPQASALYWFPLIGILLGAALAGIDRLGSLFLYDALRVMVDVAFLALVTGGLHLDGLADSADALYYHHDREKALQIMKDPRVGVMGVLALAFCLGFKAAGLWALKFESCWIWFLVAPGLARGAQVAGLVCVSHARPSGGVGAALYQKGKYLYLIPALIPLALPFWVSVSAGVIAGCLFVLVTISCLMFFQKRLGGMTGDTFGAMTEMIEALYLVLGGWACHSLGQGTWYG